MTVATSALLGQGMALKMGNGSSPQTFTTIAQVNDISGLGAESPLVDVTHYQSTAREYIYGIADGKQFTAKANYLPNDTTQMDAIAAQTNKVVKDFRMYLPSPYQVNYYRFSALVLGYEIAPPVDNKQEITFTLKISGALTYFT